MYYSSAAATHAANGSTPPHKSASLGYRLTAAAAVSGSDRFSAAAHHQAAAHHRTSTPNATHRSGAAAPHHRHHHHSSAATGHSPSGHRAQYATDHSEATHIVYRAPQMSTAQYESSPYHHTIAAPSGSGAGEHRRSLLQGSSSSTDRRRVSSSVGPSAGRSPPSATAKPLSHQYFHQTAPSSLSSAGGASSSGSHSRSHAHHTGSAPASSAAAPSLAGFCTQVSTPRPSSCSNSSGTMRKTGPSFSAAGSHRPATTQADTWVTKVPQYHEYASVRHPPHYYSNAPLLPVVHHAHKNRHLLVLDLDETLVHASAQQPASYDAAFNVDMETQVVRIYVKHRPFMMEFLRAMAQMYEVCVFTASLSKYANQVLDHIDPHKELITHRLYREHCTEVDGSYTKDMSVLGRPTENVIILDNSPVAYMFYPNNAVSCVSWFDDETDTELRTIIPKFEHIAHAPTATQGLHHRTQQRRHLL